MPLWGQYQARIGPPLPPRTHADSRYFGKHRVSLGVLLSGRCQLVDLRESRSGMIPMTLIDLSQWRGFVFGHDSFSCT